MRKKLLSLILCLLLIAGTFVYAIPTIADDPDPQTLADEAAAAEGKYFRVGEGEEAQYYEALSTAITSSPDKSTIYLIKDCNERGPINLGSSTSASFTLDGQGHTVSFSNNDGAYFWYIKGFSTTFKNMTLNVDAQPGIRFVPKFENCRLTLENMTINFNKNTGSIKDGFVCCGHYNDVAEILATTATITIKDSILSGNSAAVWAGHDGKASYTINIVNSTLENKWGSSTWPYAILLYDGAHGTKTNTKILNVDGTSKLIISTNQSGYSNPCAIRIGSNSGNAPGTCMVNFEEGAELKVVTGSSANAGKFINIEDTSKTLKINDNGAIYTASAAAQKKGVTLPPITSYQRTKIVSGLQFSNGSATVNGGAAYTNSSATEATSFEYSTATLYTDADAISEGNYFRVDDSSKSVEKQYFTTLKLALGGSDSGGTIYLIQDCGHTPMDLSSSTSAVFTLDGQGHTFNNTASFNHIWYFKGSPTIKNLTITTPRRLFKYNPGWTNAKLTLDNVTLTHTISGSSVAALGDAGDDAKGGVQNVVIKDSTISGPSALFVTGNDGTYSFNIDIRNSTIENTAGNSTYNYVILLYVGGTGSTTTAHTVSLDSTSKLINSTTADISPCLIRLGSNGSNAAALSTVNLAEGAELKLTGASGAQAGNYIHINDSAVGTTKTLVVNDSGATYTASAYMQKKGVTLPNNTGAVNIGYLANGTLLKPNHGTYTNGSATETINIQAFTFDSDDFSNIAGASIRTNADAYSPAIRFSANVAKTFHDTLYALDNTVEFGTIVVINSTREGEAITTATSGTTKVITDWEISGANATWKYNVAVFNIPEADYGVKLAATAFFTVHYSDSTAKTFLAAFSTTDNVRSLYDVAQAAYDAGNTENSIINNVISVCSAMSLQSTNPTPAPVVLSAMQTKIAATPNKVVNAGDGCYEAVYTGSNATESKYNNFCSQLASNGYTLYASNELSTGSGSKKK